MIGKLSKIASGGNNLDKTPGLAFFTLCKQRAQWQLMITSRQQDKYTIKIRTTKWYGGILDIRAVEGKDDSSQSATCDGSCLCYQVGRIWHALSHVSNLEEREMSKTGFGTPNIKIEYVEPYARSS